MPLKLATAATEARLLEQCAAALFVHSRRHHGVNRRSTTHALSAVADAAGQRAVSCRAAADGPRAGTGAAGCRRRRTPVHREEVEGGGHVELEFRVRCVAPPARPKLLLGRRWALLPLAISFLSRSFLSPLTLVFSLSIFALRAHPCIIAAARRRHMRDLPQQPVRAVAGRAGQGAGVRER